MLWSSEVYYPVPGVLAVPSSNNYQGGFGTALMTKGKFVDDGTETYFKVCDHACYIKAVSSGERHDWIVHTLFVDGNKIYESREESA
ncbi:fas apoptotic inhibitory molecule 1-like [Saccoglossus kowalevskii]